VPAAYITGSLMSEMRGFLLPSFVQSFKLAHDRKIKMKPLLALITACTIVSLVTGMWMILKLGYEGGGLSMERWWAKIGCVYPIGNAKEAMGEVTGDRSTNWIWLGIGAAVTYGIMMARSRFVWFPFHPIGYIMCAPAAMYSMWFSIFLGWLIKSLITKYGGTDAYRKVMPFFLGLITGEVTMILFWLVIDGWQGRTGHQLMPG
jgi:hypothetical protein